ncbi:Phospholipase D2 [Choanephora cucurbitarum]|uniref:Phospholipase n=1 Tax=Choanephora cucurbitarum TaxID=101091 RepID=A0A1C7NIC3_9FUNG|nr:Phospholipase D2 [Choanephora cucurbitarum]
MSNQIAATAEYFARYKQEPHPEDTHYHSNTSSPRNTFHSANDTSNPLDRRSQWQRVLNRISFLSPLDKQLEDQNERDTFELMRTDLSSSTTVIKSHSNLVKEQEEKLPSASDLANDQIDPLDPQTEESEYFKHPFQTPARKDSIPVVQVPSAVKMNSHTHRHVSSSTEADDSHILKDRWDRTLDRLKHMTYRSNTPPPPRPILIEGPSHTLATYYPPAFDPLFAAFAKDENGKRLPPILLQCIYVNVIDSEDITNNQWVFRVELQYGDVKWTIRRGIADFMSLHIKLKLKSNLYDYVPDPPNFPNQLSNLLDTAKSTIGILTKEEESQSLSQDEVSRIKRKTALHQRKELTQYLRKLLLRAHVAVSTDICEFLELSAISIVQDMGWKGKEGYLRNRINNVSVGCYSIFKTHRWKTEWIILRDSYMAFCTDTSSWTPTDVLLFDNALKIRMKEPRVYLGSYHIILSNESRKIEIKGTKREVDQWIESIDKVRRQSPWVRNHRFGSFAPVRNNAKVKWFVDGENHFNAVAEAILSAKSEIYIADWWLSPEIYLRRPPEENEDFRLDRLLHRKAKEGVKIYIIVYKDMSLALTINSVHTKQWLQNLHPNIIVQRHPDHKLSNDNTVLFWSHHEKIVVVDNRLAFIGGLDLCFGRYDTHSHSLSDHPAESHSHTIFPGQDYSNPRVKDFIDVSQHDKTLVDRRVTARMPWHDVTLGVVGPIARDIARHFIQRWNFIKSKKSMHRRHLPLLMPKGEYVAAEDESDFAGTCRVQLLRSSARWSSDIEREHSIYNAYMECIAHAKHYIYFENQFFISATQDDKLLRNRIAEALIERIKKAHARKEKFRVYVLIPLIPAFEGDLTSSDASAARNVMHFQYITISRGGHSIVEKLKEHGIDADQYISWFSLRNHGKIKVPDQSSFNDSGTLLNDDNNPFEDQPQLSRTQTNQSTAHSLKNPFNEPKSSLPEVDDDRYDYVSELLYIHDKLMIVDDRVVLMGSANINDRSQLGNRDSEIAMLVEDTELVSSYMDGKEYQASKFAHTLRMQLWKEHLGLLNFENWSQLLKDAKTPSNTKRPPPPPPFNNPKDIQHIQAQGPVKMLDRASRSFSFYESFNQQCHTERHDAAVLDPLSDQFYYQIWLKRATDNTHIYRNLFRCVPDDTIHTYEQHRKFIPDPALVKVGHVANPHLTEQEIVDQLNG